MERIPDPESRVLPAGPLPPGKDELNLAEFPIALLTDRVPAGQKTIEFRDEIYDEKKGQLVTRRLPITASDKYGLPTAKDDEVILGLIQLTKEANDFTERGVPFTRSDLLRLLGWEDTGQNYKRIETSLCRWAGVFLHWENSWWDKQQHAWTTRGFHIIEAFEINDGRPSGGPSDPLPSRFTWNEVVFRSFQAGCLKRLDLDTYLNLKHPTAKRMYRFLDKRFYHRRDWRFDLRGFAFDHIGISRTYADNGKIKEKLQPALEELEAIGFLEPMSRERRYAKVGRGEWTIALVRKASDGPETAPPGEPAVSGPSELEAALITRGVTPATAAGLVKAHPAGRVAAKLEVFDWLVGRKDRRVRRSPPGYLVESIRDDYAAPEGFESATGRARRSEAAAERERRGGETKRGAAAASAHVEEEQARIAAYRESLSPGARAALEAEALASALPSYASRYRKNRGDPKLARRYLDLIVDMHIARLLDDPPAGADGPT